MGGKQKRKAKSAKLCQFIGVSVDFHSYPIYNTLEFFLQLRGFSWHWFGVVAVAMLFCVWGVALVLVRNRQQLSARKSAHNAFSARRCVNQRKKKNPFFRQLK